MRTWFKRSIILFAAGIITILMLGIFDYKMTSILYPHRLGWLPVAIFFNAFFIIVIAFFALTIGTIALIKEEFGKK